MKPAAPLELIHKEGTLSTVRTAATEVSDEVQVSVPWWHGVDFSDGIAVVGLAAVVWGVWQIFVPAAWIVLGVSLLAFAARS